jgi:Methylase involved in ubiquinone/menaquinone biosynthesis
MVLEVLGFVSGVLKTLTSKDLVEFFDSIPELFSVLNAHLPHNRFVRVVIYGSGVFCMMYLAPYVLRHTEWFDYYYRHMSYFHRYCPLIDEKKTELFRNMLESIDNLPKYENKLMILEVQAGGGSNLTYYPEGTRLIAVEHDEKYKEQMLKNFASEESDEDFLSNVKLESFICSYPEQLVGVPDGTISAIVSIHSLCYPLDLDRCFDEFKRVLMPGGRFYFIEHTKEDDVYSLKNLQQLRFIFIFALIRCRVRRKTQDFIRRAGFSEVNIEHFNLDMEKVTTKPLQVLSPHIYGYAIK